MLQVSLEWPIEPLEAAAASEKTIATTTSHAIHHNPHDHRPQSPLRAISLPSADEPPACLLRTR